MAPHSHPSSIKTQADAVMAQRQAAELLASRAQCQLQDMDARVRQEVTTVRKRLEDEMREETQSMREEHDGTTVCVSVSVCLCIVYLASNLQQLQLAACPPTHFKQLAACPPTHFSLTFHSLIFRASWAPPSGFFARVSFHHHLSTHSDEPVVACAARVC